MNALTVPELTHSYEAWFFPVGCTGKGPTLTLSIPECECWCLIEREDARPLCVLHNRPHGKPRVSGWIKIVCEVAAFNSMAVGFVSDTAEQVERAASIASRQLPQHQRVALERMDDAALCARLRSEWTTKGQPGGDREQ